MSTNQENDSFCFLPLRLINKINFFQEPMKTHERKLLARVERLVQKHCQRKAEVFNLLFWLSHIIYFADHKNGCSFSLYNKRGVISDLCSCSSIEYRLPDDVLVAQLFQCRDFTDGCRWNSFILVFQADLLHCNDFVWPFISSLINDTVGSCVYNRDVHAKRNININAIFIIITKQPFECDFGIIIALYLTNKIFRNINLPSPIFSIFV